MHILAIKSCIMESVDHLVIVVVFLITYWSVTALPFQFWSSLLETFQLLC